MLGASTLAICLAPNQWVTPEQHHAQSHKRDLVWACSVRTGCSTPGGHSDGSEDGVSTGQPGCSVVSRFGSLAHTAGASVEVEAERSEHTDSAEVLTMMVADGDKTAELAYYRILAIVLLTKACTGDQRCSLCCSVAAVELVASPPVSATAGFGSDCTSLPTLMCHIASRCTEAEIHILQADSSLEDGTRRLEG